jgi:hypothetical protein
MLITIWERLNEKTGKYQHNHIEDGVLLSATKPSPISKLQERSWANAIWRKEKAELIDNVVVRD